jgi:hypothetical protein
MEKKEAVKEKSIRTGYTAEACRQVGKDRARFSKWRERSETGGAPLTHAKGN